MMAAPIETTMTIENASYSNISELQPELLNLSTNNPYQLDFLVCRVCKQFAIAPRQCCVCKALTCNECSTTLTKPHKCVQCIKRGYKHGKLGLPNQLEGKATQVTETSLFDCGNRCGIVDLTLAEMERHLQSECDLREFPTKKSVYDQSLVLQAQLEENEPQYTSMIEQMNQRVQALINDRKKKVKDLQNKFADITPVCEDIEKRLVVLETPRMRELAVAKSFEPFKLPLFAQEKSGNDTSMSSTDFHPFEWQVPRHFLSQATEQAINNGLLTKITVGSRPDSRSLTSLRLTFHNGRKEITTPLFGSFDMYKTVEMGMAVHHVTACYWQDLTCFLMLNRDPELTFGAQLMDVADQAEEVEYTLRDTQVIIGVYGVKVRHENDVILRFSFILNNDF